MGEVKRELVSPPSAERGIFFTQLIVELENGISAVPLAARGY